MRPVVACLGGGGEGLVPGNRGFDFLNIVEENGESRCGGIDAKDEKSVY
jgi:hypothetical protein